MDFVSNRDPQIEAMLASIGVDKVLDLFSSIPPSLLLPQPTFDDGLSECEGLEMMERLASQNSFPRYKNYLGAGAYEHYIPALVAAITSKSEFLTSYTPYQAEVSQGMLQAIFEYQTAVCALTGLDVANASVWDGASAAAEGVLMALRHHKERGKLLLGETLYPRYEGVVRQYLASHNMEVVKIRSLPTGQVDLEDLERNMSEEVAAVLVQSPNSLGVIEPMEVIGRLAHEKGALVIQSANPLSFGLYQPPGETGVDIAVGDTQPFGLPLNFGGPYAGYMAAKEFLTRQLPGRLVGEARDKEGRVGYTLVLQAREQHIRREKALSNICTNQALAALASLIAILWYGKEGVKQLALTNFQRASYLKSLLPRTLEGPIFNEFAVGFTKPLKEVKRHFRARGIEPGWETPLLKNHLVVAVTEVKSKADLDRYAEAYHDCL